MDIRLITLNKLEESTMLALNTINGYDENIILAGSARQQLWRFGFYESFRLNRLIEVFKEVLGTSLSSVSLSADGSMIELRLRQTYLNKIKPEFYNEDKIITAMHQWYKEYSYELVKILNGLDGNLQTGMITSMLYHMQRQGNTIIINFI